MQGKKRSFFHDFFVVVNSSKWIISDKINLVLEKKIVHIAYTQPIKKYVL